MLFGQIKTHPMKIGRAEFPYFIPVFLGWITFVLLPIVYGKLNMKFFHIVVPVGFGQDRRSGDRHIFTVSLYNAKVGNIFVFFKAIAVDDDVLRAQGELVQSPMHGQNRSIEDIDPVDFMINHKIHSPGQPFFIDEEKEFLPVLLCQLFGIVEQFVGEIVW